MSEFRPVTTKADLDQLNYDEIAAGREAGLRNASEPGNDKSRAFWHGWRNGMVDGGHRLIDAEQIRLAFAVKRHYEGRS